MWNCTFKKFCRLLCNFIVLHCVSYFRWIMKYFGSKFKPEILGSQATKNWFCDCVCILDHVADVKHTHLTALFAGLPGWAGTRKLKPMWILLKQETVSGSGISWAVCKSTCCSRQITTPAPHHSVFSGRMLFPPPRSWCYCVCVWLGVQRPVGGGSSTDEGSDWSQGGEPAT